MDKHGWSVEDQAVRPRIKRARVTLACQRCKTRKQKCDGGHPSCGSCTRLDVDCKYIVPLHPKPGERKLYVKALEDRIAELESYLSGAGFSVGEDHWLQQQSIAKTEQPPDEIDSLLNAVRDLSLSASGYYVGGTSTITLGRVLGSVVNTEVHRVPGPTRSRHAPEDPNPRSIATVATSEMIGPMFISSAVAEKLLQGYMKHIATRYPVLHSPLAKNLHERRNDTLSVYEESLLHLVYATSGRYLETTGDMGHYFCDQHYDAALAKMDEILEFRDTRSITYLLLLAVYCLRAPRDPGTWIYSGLGMRLCIDLGLHRHQRHLAPSLQGELEKRLFWSCYHIDREVSIALGRPMAISDHDIDVKLPFDIDEAAIDERTITEALPNVRVYPSDPPSTLTSFIHHVRLKRIESRIQHAIYRVDEPIPVSPETIQSFLNQLHVWKDAIPQGSETPDNSDSEPFEGIDAYMIPYYKCIRFLLYPQLSNSPLNSNYLSICAEACGGVCTTYKRLHHSFSVSFSPSSLQSVFLAGLTLIYCTWLSPAYAPSIDTGPLTDCSIMLYVMTERWPSARKYRDVFERIKTSVNDLLLKDRRKRTSLSGPVTGLSAAKVVDAELKERCKSLDENFLGSGRNDFTQMIDRMAGDCREFWNSAFIDSNVSGANAFNADNNMPTMDKISESANMMSMPDSNDQISPTGDFENIGENSGESYDEFGNDWTVPTAENGYNADFVGSWSSAGRM